MHTGYNKPKIAVRKQPARTLSICLLFLYVCFLCVCVCVCVLCLLHFYGILLAIVCLMAQCTGELGKRE